MKEAPTRARPHAERLSAERFQKRFGDSIRDAVGVR
jgi:hypothetical protein